MPLAVTSVLAAMVLVVLSAAMVNVALPNIAEAFGVLPAESVWVITAYQAALLIALFPSAALGERLGHRRVFTWGVALFSAASVLCALSPSLAVLVAARFLQGLGAAAVMALGLALLRAIVPAGQFGSAIGWNALAVALSSAAGPTAGAALLSGAGWPWLFTGMLPLGLAVLIACKSLPRTGGTGRRLDMVSVVFNAATFGALIVGVDQFPRAPLAALLLLIVAIVFAVALIRRELPREAPLIPFDLLRDYRFSVSVVASILCFAGVTAALVALPFYLRHSLGQDTWMTGLYMTPWPLTVAVAAPVAGRLANRLPGAWLCAAGGACMAGGLAAAAIWPLDGGLQALVPLTMLCGLGFGLFNVANNRTLLVSAPSERSGAAGGMQGTARLLGQTAGAVAIALLFGLSPAAAVPQFGLATGALLTLAAGLLSLWGRKWDRRPAA